jgi:hypothetical protein
MNPPATVSINVPEPTLTKPQVQKRSWKRIEKKDEKMILKGLREFKPLYLIAQDIGVCRATLYTYLREEMNISYKDMRESMLDIAESRLLKNILDGNQNAIQFFLDRQGKGRGYGEKQQLDRQDVPTINIGKIEVNGAESPLRTVKEVVEVQSE